MLDTVTARAVVAAAAAVGLLAAPGALVRILTMDDVHDAVRGPTLTSLSQPPARPAALPPETCPVRSEPAAGVVWAVEASLPMTEPVVSQGVAIVRVNGESFSQGCVVGVEAVSGRVMWTAPAWTGSGAPLVAGGVVVAAVDFGIVALDLRTGVERWSAGRMQPHSGADPRPSVVPPVVYHIAIAGDLVVAISGNDVTAYSLQTGHLAWQAHVPYAYSMVPGEGVVFVHGLNPESLFAIETSNGAVRWQRSARMQPDVASKDLLIGYLNSRYFGISPVDGSTLWEVEAPGGNAFSGSVLANGLVVLPVDGPLGSIYALDGRTGGRVWHIDVGQRESFHHSTPVVGSSLFMAAPDVFLALDPSTGKERWRQAIDGDLTSELLVTPDVVYVGGASGSLFAFNGQKGTIVGRGRAGGGIGGNLARSDDLILATRAGNSGPPGFGPGTLVALRVP